MLLTPAVVRAQVSLNNQPHLLLLEQKVLRTSVSQMRVYTCSGRADFRRTFTSTSQTLENMMFHRCIARFLTISVKLNGLTETTITQVA